MKKQGGFTIIEIVVTLAVASLFLYGAYILMIGAISSAREARNRNTAAHLALKKIDELRTDYNNVPAPCPGANPACAATVVPFPSSNPVNYTLNLTTSQTSGTTIYGDTYDKKEVRVTVTWNDGKAKTLIMETTVSPYTPQ